MLKQAVILVSFVLTGTQALASGNAAVLRLHATGTILPAPEWQDEKSRLVETLNLDFGGQMAYKDPATNRDSVAERAKLVNSSTDPAEVVLVRPKKCFIGITTVLDDFVYVLMDAVELSTDQLVKFKRNFIYSIALRFSALGKYGSASGIVKCQTPGTLTYAY